MKVLFIGSAQNIHTIRWVNALCKKNIEVVLVSNKNHCEYIQDNIDSKVEIVKLPYSGSKGYYLNAYFLKKIFKQFKPDIVNAHYASGYGTLARIANVRPLLLSVWGADVYSFPYESIFKNKIIRKNLNYADMIASTSNSMAVQIKKLLETNKNIEITYFGVDTKVFKFLESYKELNTFEVGVVKTLEKKYGIEYIIKGFKLFLENKEQDNCDCRLVIFGKGGEKEYLKNLCKDLNIENKVIFKGYVENSKLPEYISKMDVFCLGSIEDSESFGVAAVEAMACGVPVIATDVSGFKEVIKDNETGFIVARENYVEIADKLLILYNDTDLRKKLGDNGIKRVNELYNWDDNVNQMINVYKKVIGLKNTNRI